MREEKKQQEKAMLHPRNKNRERYDLEALTACIPELANHVKPNKSGDASVDFSNPVAVKLLNKALLNHYYGIKNWEFPDGNLCPPVPGRADYIHYVADLFMESNFGRMPPSDKVTCLDIGLGASCIYPIVGVTEYGWNFIGSDIEAKSIASAKSIVSANPPLNDKIECRLQANPKAVFKGIVGIDERIDVTLCNPPFHATAEDAQKGTRRKVKNLSGKRDHAPELNFSGISNELICEGGESSFIRSMVTESKAFGKNVYWFTTLVSKASNLKGIYNALADAKAVQVKTIPMGTGNKSTRIVAWSFLDKEGQKVWRDMRWKK